MAKRAIVLGVLHSMTEVLQPGVTVNIVGSGSSVGGSTTIVTPPSGGGGGNTIERFDTIAVFNSAEPHGFYSGNTVTITGADQAEYNVVGATVTVITPDCFAFQVANTAASPATGTIEVAFVANGPKTRANRLVAMRPIANLVLGYDLDTPSPVTLSDNNDTGPDYSLASFIAVNQTVDTAYVINTNTPREILEVDIGATPGPRTSFVALPSSSNTGIVVDSVNQRVIWSENQRVQMRDIGGSTTTELVDPADPLVVATITDMVMDYKRGRLLFLQDNTGLFAVDFATTTVTTISNSDGGIPNSALPENDTTTRGLTLDAETDTAYALAAVGDTIISYNVNTGIRSDFAAVDSARSYHSLALDKANNRILCSDTSSADIIYAFDLDDGSRTSFDTAQDLVFGIALDAV